VTDKCRKWNADGTLKNKECSDGKEKIAHKAFAQLKSKTEYNEKLLIRNSLRRTSAVRRRGVILLMTLPILTAIPPEGMGRVAQRNYVCK
jgi:hypothetical protein